MKSRNAICLLFACFLALHLPARAAEDSSIINDSLQKNIVKLLDHPDLSTLKGDTFNVEIQFMITRWNEILVLPVKSDDTYFDQYVKDQLNYQKVKIRGARKMAAYKIAVTFSQPSVIAGA